MIRVRYDWNPAVGRLRLTVRGHAGAAPAGRDLVCASASILAYTAEAVLRDAERGRVEIAEVQTADGLFTVDAVCDGRTEELVDAVCTGFRLLAEQYPRYVRFEKSFGNGEKSGSAVR